MSNRFTNLNISRFDPLSWEDISRVPLQKRAEHNARQQALSELDTNIGMIDNLGVHDKQARAIQDEYHNKLDKLTSSLSSEGVNGFNIQDVLDLNSQYKKDWGPGGRAKNLIDAKITKNANDARWMAGAASDKWDLNIAQRELDKYNSTYKGVDENGNIVQPKQGFMTKNYNIQKTIEDKFKHVAANVDTIIENKPWEVRNIDGQYVMWNKESNKRVEENSNQIQAAMDSLNTIMAPGTSEYAAAQVQGIEENIPEMISQEAAIHGYKKVTRQERENIRNIPKTTNNSKTIDNGSNNDFVIPVDTAKTFKNVNEITKKNNVLKGEINTLAGKPNATQRISIKKSEIRDNENFTFEAEREALNNQEYIQLKKDAQKELDDKLIPELEVLVKNDSRIVNNEKLKKYLEISIQSLKDTGTYEYNADMEHVVVANQFGGAGADKAGADILRKIRNVTEPATTLHDKITSEYVSNNARQLFEVRTMTTNKEDKEFQGQINKFIVDNSSLNPTLVKGDGLFEKSNLASWISDSTFNKTVKGKLTKDVFSKLTDGTSKNVNTNIAVDGDNIYLTVRGTLPEGYKFKTGFRDGVKDKIVIAGESAKVKVRLNMVTPEGIKTVTPAEIQVIKATNLSNDNKLSMIEKLYTQTIKPTYYEDKLGENPFSRDVFFGVKNKIGDSDTLDALKDNSGKFSTIYSLDGKDKGNNPVTISSIVDKFGDKREAFQFLSKINVIGTFKNVLRDMSVDNTISFMKESGANRNSDIYQALLSYSDVEPDKKASDIFWIGKETKASKEHDAMLIDLIMNSNLIITKPSDLLPLNN